MNIQKLSYTDLIPSLFETVPEFIEYYDQHQTDKSVYWIPGFCFQIFAQFVIEIHVESKNHGQTAGLLNRCFSFIERVLDTKDEMIDSIAALSFVGQLYLLDKEHYAELKEYMGAETRVVSEDSIESKNGLHNITYFNVDQYLLENVPEFQGFYQEYLKDQHGEYLPHILFADLTRFVVQQYRRLGSQKDSEDVLRRCFAFIERLLKTKDKFLYNLVAVSFVENLYDPTEDYYKPLQNYAQPETRALFIEMFGQS